VRRTRTLWRFNEAKSCENLDVSDKLKAYRGWQHCHVVFTYGWLNQADEPPRLVPLTILTEARDKKHIYWCAAISRTTIRSSPMRGSLQIKTTPPRWIQIWLRQAMSRHLTELCRRDTHDSAENLGEMALVCEPGRFCNLTDRELGTPEEYLCTVNPAPQGILVRA